MGGDLGLATEYQWITVSAFGLPIPDANALLDIVRELGDHGVVVTAYRSVDGAPFLTYTLDALEQDAPAAFRAGRLYFQAKDGVSGTLEFGARPYATMWTRAGADESDVELWSAVARSWAERAPDFLVMGFAPPAVVDERGRSTWRDEYEMQQVLLASHCFMPPKDYYPFGPRGIGFRTYFSPRFVEMIGLQRLRSTPGSVTELDEGGMLVDVSEGLLSSGFAELVAAWAACQKHLATSGVFAPPSVDEDRKRIRFRTKGPAYVHRPRPG